VIVVRVSTIGDRGQLLTREESSATVRDAVHAACEKWFGATGKYGCLEPVGPGLSRWKLSFGVVHKRIDAEIVERESA
jgi:hypothetical protein